MNNNVSPKLVKSCTAVLVVAASVAALSGIARLGIWFWQGEESSVIINKARALAQSKQLTSKRRRVLSSTGKSKNIAWVEPSLITARS